MNDKEYLRKIGFDQVKDMDYMDDGIAILTDIRELPIEKGSLQVDMVLIVACISGKLQVELNALSYTLHQNEILVYLPNAIIDNCMLSPDFKGAVLCLSQRGLLEQISWNEIWDKVFRISDNPIIHISEKDMRMFELYKLVLMEKLGMERSSYYREIIVSIVKAILYELLASVEKESVSFVGGMIKQREILFKRFIELLFTTRIKPRNVSWYAQKLCVTSKYLSTVCRQVSGKTAYVWINEYVSMDIRYWLKNTDRTIKEIAEILTFPNISFFGKYCRSHFGMSPTEYRKQLRDTPTKNNVQLK